MLLLNTSNWDYYSVFLISSPQFEIASRKFEVLYVHGFAPWTFLFFPPLFCWLNENAYVSMPKFLFMPPGPSPDSPAAFPRAYFELLKSIFSKTTFIRYLHIYL